MWEYIEVQSFVSQIICILRDLFFITHRTNPAAFGTYNFVFHACIDIVMSNPGQAENLAGQLAPIQSNIASSSSPHIRTFPRPYPYQATANTLLNSWHTPHTPDHHSPRPLFPQHPRIPRHSLHLPVLYLHRLALTSTLPRQSFRKPLATRTLRIRTLSHARYGWMSATRRIKL